jgi:hypothetical protein
MAAAAQKHKHSEELEWLVFDFGEVVSAGTNNNYSNNLSFVLKHSTTSPLTSFD